MGTVLFVSRRPLNRCENILAVYNAYDGDKEFIRYDWRAPDPRIGSKEFDLVVTDDFLGMSPGKMILIGHGISGGKSYGFDQPRPYVAPDDSRLITWAVSTSEETRQLTADNSHIPVEKVLPLGMPRTDAYFGKKKGNGGTFLRKKRAYLFAPTFRGRDEPRMPEYDWSWLDEQLTSQEILVVKPHMVTRGILGTEYAHIVEVSPLEPSTPYLIDCDVLITDYSSILFDGHVLGKPVVLFEKKTGFVQKRGMYFPYPEGYASRYVTTEKELLKTIRAADVPGPEDLACKERACGACDGHSTERVVDLIRRTICGS